MIDYKSLEALYTTLELQSFEKASQKLHLTQSAISQRIKSLEDRYGEPLLIRSLPYRPTQLGEQLIGHFKRVALLENSLIRHITGEKTRHTIAIAINRDSLETWFLDFMSEDKVLDDINLEIVADDQELTLSYFRKGLVSACLSTTEKALPGGKSVFLGNMEYLLVASPDFAEKHFFGKNWKKSLLEATAVKFDKNDILHERYLEKYFGLDGRDMPFHIVPSVRGFKKFAVRGYGYALIPRIDILDELKNKKLINLQKNKIWNIPLYWHYWDTKSEAYLDFNLNIIHYVKNLLG